MSFTYANIDGSANVDAAVAWQDRIDRWPQIARYKARVQQLLGDARSVLDVGCGTGRDVRDRGVGVDASVAMCRTARARGAAVAAADAGCLPFAPRTFDGVVADRVVQHLASPVEALAELARVLQPGGRLVVADPDQETLSIELPGVRVTLVDRVKALRRDIGYRNGRFVGTLPTRLLDLGFGGATIEAFPLLLTDPDDAFGLPGWPRFWQAEGGFTAGDIAEWDAGVERGRAGGFVYAVSYFVVSGVRPAS